MRDKRCFFPCDQ